MKRSLVRSSTSIGRKFRPGSLALIALALMSASGCYQYLPSQVDPAPLGDDVRLLVTRDGASELASVTDLNSSVPRIEGTLESSEASMFMVRVPIAGSQSQPGMFSNIGQLVRIPTNQILSVERKEFDGTMTALLVGGAAVGGTLLLVSIIDAFGSGNPRGDPDPVLSIRVPMIGFGR